MSDQERSPSCGSPNCSENPHLQLFQTILFAAPVVFALLILLLFCMIYFRRNGRSNIHAQMRARIFARQFLSTPDLEQGLSKSFRQKLPIISFDEKYVATHADTQCAVCLGDYQSDEKLQQLPGCNHCFHFQCIDEWLSKNTTCPICRTSLLRQRGADSFDSIQPSDASGVEMLRRDYDEQWEGRIIGQGVSFHTQADAFNGATSSSSVSAIQISGESRLNTERS